MPAPRRPPRPSARRWSSPGSASARRRYSSAGLGLLGLAALALAWVELATPRRLVRAAGSARGWSRASRFGCAFAPQGGRVPLPGGELTDPVLDEPVAVGPALGRDASTARSALDGRGRRRLAPARLVVRDPLGLCARELVSDRASELLVLPRIEPVLVGGRGRGRLRPARRARGRERGRTGSTRARSSSRSTACAPTARAARRRASTGPPSREPAS